MQTNLHSYALICNGVCVHKAQDAFLIICDVICLYYFMYISILIVFSVIHILYFPNPISIHIYTYLNVCLERRVLNLNCFYLCLRQISLNSFIILYPYDFRHDSFGELGTYIDHESSPIGAFCNHKS